MRHPTIDPLEYVFQLHPLEEDYLDYMKENRSSLNERKKIAQDKEKERIKM